MRTVELILCSLLALGGLGHLAGTITGYPAGSEVFVWSLTATAFVFLLVFLHVLRIYRPEDRPVRVAASVASVAWVGLALAFGAAVGNIADPRALMHAIVTAGLLVTSALGTRARPAGEAAMA